MEERKLKILMIDDDEQILYALRAVFEFQNWLSCSAGDVVNGVELFKKERPDLVFIDYHLPRINGIKGVELLRELDREVPIIVFTIDENQEVADKFIEAGASDFALKPIKVLDIISRIRLHVRLMDVSKKLKKEKEILVPVLAKGIGQATLDLIKEAFQKSEGVLTVEEISEKTGFAYQTTYRYLQYMVSQQMVEVSQSYGKIGRPKQRYRLKK